MTLTTTQRVHSLDALRGGALILGVLFHAAFSFFPGDQIWLIKDINQSAGVAGLAFILHMFRMTIFFLIAGYFGHLMLNRLGTVPFIGNRLKRIGGPLVLFWPIVMACFIALAVWGMVVANGGSMPENPPEPPPMTLANFPLTHLWFLYILLLFYACMLLIRMLTRLIDPKQKVAQLLETCLLKFSWLPLLPILLAFPVAHSLLGIEAWHPFFGIPTPEYGFVPDITALVTYGSAFALGWFLHRHTELLSCVTRLWRLYLVTAMALSGFCLYTVGTTITYVQIIPEQIKTAYVAAYALALWCWVFGLIGMCLKVWSQESTVRRYIADASYWIYLVHLPIVMALQVLVSQWSLPAELKYILILALAIPLMLLSYEYLVRYSFIGRLINGHKRKRIAKLTTEHAS